MLSELYTVRETDNVGPQFQDGPHYLEILSRSNTYYCEQ